MDADAHQLTVSDVLAIRNGDDALLAAVMAGMAEGIRRPPGDLTLRLSEYVAATYRIPLSLDLGS